MNESRFAPRRLLAPAVVGAILVASVIAAALVWAAERDDARRANQALARQVAAIAEREVELTAASLRGGEGLLRRSGPMSERGFRRFARDVVFSTPFPSLAWAPRVPARERARFERALGRTISEPRAPTDQNPKGDLRPVGQRGGAYLPMRFVHPDERAPRRLLGLDLLSEPARATAVRVARDLDRSAITTPIVPPGGEGPVVILVDPVYHAGSRHTSVRERQLALAGMLTGTISADAIRTEIAAQVGAGTEVEIADGETPLIVSGGGDERESMAVDVLGRDWTVRVEDVEQAAALPALAVGGVGVALAALTAALFALAGRREQMLSHERDLAAGEAEAQRSTATALQQAFLPPSLPEVQGAETAAVYSPGAEGLEVGGDFYDLFETGDHWTAMIGDVSGKGARAAALTALVRHTARGIADRGPVGATRAVNDAVRRETPAGTFATACIASLRPTPAGIDVGIVVAGHPPPFIVRNGGAIEPIQPSGPLVGVLDEVEMSESRVRLAPGETLFLYTDGLIEARRRGAEPLGEDRLRAALAEARDTSPREMVRRALALAAEYSADFPQDDVAILAIRAR
jgi:serine phosphatase RsbU (regulator of sigma subunit)/CHASE1-domain containing sensor protein